MYRIYNPTDDYYMTKMGDNNLYYIGKRMSFIHHLYNGYGKDWDGVEYNKYFSYPSKMVVKIKHIDGRTIVYLEEKYVGRFKNKTETFYDGAMRELNPEDFREEVEKYKEKMNSIGYRRTWNMSRCTSPYYFKYRRGPVPHTGKWDGWSGERTKRGCKQRLIMYTDPTFQEEGKARKPSRRQDYDSYVNETFRHTERNWKSQTKYRHQWERKRKK